MTTMRQCPRCAARFTYAVHACPVCGHPARRPAPRPGVTCVLCLHPIRRRWWHRLIRPLPLCGHDDYRACAARARML